jgi:tRNA(Ile)-lysidine synthetase-like protein
MELLALVGRKDGHGKVSLPHLNAWRSFRKLLIYQKAQDFGPLRSTILEAPGEAHLNPAGARIRLLPAPDLLDNYNGSSRWLNGDLAPGPFLLRVWADGDSYQPCGLQRECRLKSLFQSKRIPAWERVAWPVLQWRDQIVWARRFGVAETWKAKAGSPAIEIMDDAENPRE